MLLIKSDFKYIDQLKNITSRYSCEFINSVDENKYFLYSDQRFLIQDENYIDTLVHFDNSSLTDNEMKLIFDSFSFQYMRARRGETFKDYTYNDYIMHLADINNNSFDNDISYLFMSFISDDQEYIQIRRSDKKLYTNEDKKIFSTEKIDEFYVNIVVEANCIIIDKDMITYEFNPETFRVK